MLGCFYLSKHVYVTVLQTCIISTAIVLSFNCNLESIRGAEKYKIEILKHNSNNQLTNLTLICLTGTQIASCTM